MLSGIWESGHLRRCGQLLDFYSLLRPPVETGSPKIGRKLACVVSLQFGGARLPKNPITSAKYSILSLRIVVVVPESSPSRGLPSPFLSKPTDVWLDNVLVSGVGELNRIGPSSSEENDVLCLSQTVVYPPGQTVQIAERGIAPSAQPGNNHLYSSSVSKRAGSPLLTVVLNPRGLTAHVTPRSEPRCHSGS
jgi:hypothetical protein